MQTLMLLVWLLQVCFGIPSILAQPPTCYRSSPYMIPATSGDNGFRITVEGSFKTYVPGRTYKSRIETINVIYKLTIIRFRFSFIEWL
jgi:hypothetical protein